MERAIAIAKLGKLLGKKLGYRVNKAACSLEDREAAKAKMPAALAVKNKLKEERDQRYKAILAADTEYQRLHTAHKVASENVAQLSSIIHSRKITVGISESMFFLVKAEGDSWEEVIDKVTKKEGA